MEGIVRVDASSVGEEGGVNVLIAPLGTGSVVTPKPTADGSKTTFVDTVAVPSLPKGVSGTEAHFVSSGAGHTAGFKIVLHTPIGLSAGRTATTLSTRSPGVNTLSHLVVVGIITVDSHVVGGVDVTRLNHAKHTGVGVTVIGGTTLSTKSSFSTVLIPCDVTKSTKGGSVLGILCIEKDSFTFPTSGGTSSTTSTTRSVLVTFASLSGVSSTATPGPPPLIALVCTAGTTGSLNNLALGTITVISSTVITTSKVIGNAGTEGTTGLTVTVLATRTRVVTVVDIL